MSDSQNWGHFEITLEKYLKDRNISKNKLMELAEVQRTQLLNYCKNKIQRPDLDVLARICYALKCDLSDIIKYVPPNEE